MKCKWIPRRLNKVRYLADGMKPNASTLASCFGFFSRLRNMIEGQHHGVSPKYLSAYANHAAWQEDNRRTDNGTLAKVVVCHAMGSPVSRSWKGYWQRAA